jgi:hypothetical protein
MLIDASIQILLCYNQLVFTFIESKFTTGKITRRTRPLIASIEDELEAATRDHCVYQSHGTYLRVGVMLHLIQCLA